MEPNRSRALYRLDAIEPEQGAAYVAALPAGFPSGDAVLEPVPSALELLEDGVRLGPAHAQHADIRTMGAGRFSHWGRTLYFSTSDNSDPRHNGRDYHAYLPPRGDASSARSRALEILRALPEGYQAGDAYSTVEKLLAVLYPKAKLGEDVKAFWSDQEFLHAFQRLSGENFRSLERKYTVAGLVGALDWLEGDLAECGVYNGATAYFMALAGADLGRSRCLHLFDSFQGLSAPREMDGNHWHRGDLAIAETVARDNLARFPGCRFYAGWIPDRFAEVADRRFCFVHIDVDIYEPTAASIGFFYPRLNPGGMLLCDDYGFETCPGARSAMDEFFADKPERIVHLPTGQGLIIKR
jgi:hypothetical protein